MDSYWQAEFAERMEKFDVNPEPSLVPASIKVRVMSGCFHREHSPAAYRQIDDYVEHADLSEIHYKIEEHESGPEILVYLTLTAAGLGFAKSLVELITAIIKARSEGQKKGDRPADPIEVIVRGHTKDGEYIEERIMEIPAGTTITVKQLSESLPKQSKLAAKKRKKK